MSEDNPAAQLRFAMCWYKSLTGKGHTFSTERLTPQDVQGDLTVFYTDGKGRMFPVVETLEPTSNLPLIT